MNKANTVMVNQNAADMMHTSQIDFIIPNRPEK
jgi:hypothetical protein